MSSASGMTAALAINYCERLGLSYTVSAHAVAEGGNHHYHVQRVESRASARKTPTGEVTT